MDIKIFLISILLIFLVGYVSGQMLYCADSDGGVIYDVKGDVNFSSASNPNPAQMYKNTDLCKLGTNDVGQCTGDNCFISEYSCSGTSGNWNVSNEVKTCLSLGFEGCKDGACYGTAPAAVTETCFDGIKNQTESDVDCGGGCSTQCSIGQDCEFASDCASGNCTDMGVCDAMPGNSPGSNCTNGIKDYDEQGVDCGGAYCGPCATDYTSPPYDNPTTNENGPAADYQDTTPPATDYQNTTPTPDYQDTTPYGPATDFEIPSIAQDCINCAPIVCIGSGGEFGWVIILALVFIVLFFILKVIELILRFLSLFRGGGTVNVIEKRIDQGKEDRK